MNTKKIEFIESEAFEKHINIALCNEIITFVLNTSEKANKILSSKVERCIWLKKKEMWELKAIDKIKYLGELLERYEEKIGNDIKNIRAISLALGYVEEYITDNMIIGTQLIDFINKVERMAKNDIYLQGALFLYDSRKYYQYGKELLDRKYTNTEEILFVLSLFEDIEENFCKLREQIIPLLGIKKTISAINNIKVYAWIINRLYDLIKKDRKKDMSILKALIIVPTKQIKENDIAYQTLSENGYQKEEIAYLNYAILYYVNIPKTVRIGNSITEERIAIEFCKIILDECKEYSQSMYDLLKKMIEEYNRFDIKCEGYGRLKDILEEKIGISNPITFLEFYEIFNKEIFRFDILDERWDILVEKMDSEEYKELFDKYIYSNNFDKIKLEKCIKRYNTLTDSSYIDSFYIFQYGRESIFSQLVNKEIISLKEFYETYENQGEVQEKSIKHMIEYVKKIRYRHAFLFLEYILEERKFNIEDIGKLGFELDCLYQRRYAYYDKNLIDIKRDFLDNMENQKLFYWLERYVFKVEPKYYLNFLVEILKSSDVIGIISKEQLREIYISLSKVNETVEKDEMLRKEYLTQEELQNIIEKEEEEKKQKKMQELKEMQEQMKEEFDEIDSKDFETLHELCRKYRWDNEKWKICSEMVRKYLSDNIINFKLDEKEIIEFMELIETLLDKKTITIEELKEWIIKYIMKGELYNGAIKKTY